MLNVKATAFFVFDDKKVRPGDVLQVDKNQYRHLKELGVAVPVAGEETVNVTPAPKPERVRGAAPNGNRPPPDGGSAKAPKPKPDGTGEET